MHLTHRHLATRAGLATAVLALSACGGPYGGTAETDATGSGADPCALVADDQLEATLGLDLDSRGPAEPTSGGSTCAWSFDDPSGTPGSLSITTWRGTTFFSDALGRPLDGIGDEARTDPGLGAVLFRAGEDVVQVQVLPSAHLAAAQDIASLAAGAL